MKILIFNLGICDAASKNSSRLKCRLCGGMRGIMTKDVLISIAGLQFEAEAEDAVEVISRGEYYKKNGKHYLVYDELSEEEQAVSKCLLKISEQKVELTKKGSTNVHILFEEGKANMTYYNTPYGDLMLGITTHKIRIKEEEQLLELSLQYAIDMNYQHVSECELSVRVEPVDRVPKE